MPSGGIPSWIKKFVCGYSYCLGVDGCVFLMGAECGGVLGVFFVCGGGVGFGGVVVLRNILRWVGVIGVPPCGGVVRLGGALWLPECSCVSGSGYSWVIGRAWSGWGWSRARC